MRPLYYRLIIVFVLITSIGYCQTGKNETTNGEILTKRKDGNPFQNMPENIEVLTSFGERADISPDNGKVAFMSKAFGDAMVIDLKTKNISCLTCNIPAASFLRVMHLSNGDFLLTGPDHFENAEQGKRESYLWYLSKETGSKPVKLGPKVNEGLAVSKKSMKVAYTEKHTEAGVLISKLVMADLVISDNIPSLVAARVIQENNQSGCTLEAQDFYEADTKMTFFCYVPNGLFEVKGLDLKTGTVTNFSNAAQSFNEPEGIFPDGKYTTVEADRQCEWLGGQRGSSNIDIWKLKLDGTGKNFVRLTHFNDYETGKVSNPVVATNGKFMAFQAARSTDPPGVGHGLLIYRFSK